MMTEISFGVNCSLKNKPTLKLLPFQYSWCFYDPYLQKQTSMINQSSTLSVCCGKNIFTKKYSLFLDVKDFSVFSLSCYRLPF